MAPPTKSGGQKEEVIKSLPPDLLPVFEQLVDEYKCSCIEHYGRPLVSYLVLGDLVRAGWRPTHETFVKFKP